jgi:hypothetical protein
MSSNESTDRHGPSNAIPQDDPPLRSRADVSRENGAKSRGPVTAEGKQRVAQNATKHGLYAKQLVIRGESHDEFVDLVEALADDLAANGETERQLVELMAAGIWKRKRYERIESQLFHDALDRWEDGRGAIEPEVDAVGVDRAPETYWDLVLQGDHRSFFNAAQQAQMRAVRQFRGALSDLLKARKAAGAAPGPERSREGDGAPQDRSAGLWPAPVHCEEPREGASPEGESIVDASEADAISQSAPERAEAGLESGDPKSRESSIDGQPSPFSLAEHRDETNPAERTTTRGATPTEEAERVRPVGSPRVFLG